MSTRTAFRQTCNALTRFPSSTAPTSTGTLSRSVLVPSPRRWNHGKINFQPREAQYSFYDGMLSSIVCSYIVSIQQPAAHPPGENPIPAMIQEAEEYAKTQELAARMDEESGRTTGAGRPPTPPVPKIIFGSRLAGPAARPPPPPDKIRVVEGIKVPPRPDEPDNCCMSYVPHISPCEFGVKMLMVGDVCIVCGICIGRILKIGRVPDRRLETRSSPRRRGFLRGWVERRRSRRRIRLRM